ncbi:SDR family NAD(P)-dependent oxidoreductase [Nesterenkonia sp. E16_7]|uniref:SDR family NAD(P)-dependent oxidoreductase n=1 Tax=unclassified Nesterenkonia TaxID=2629769 RepID=UPI001A932609|nr:MULTISPECIES: SDR family NAD(P)-dependent oxidoreductase [unclassified Nesterenkonia]MBO0594694.1 SDR family NAD(P)-dependent oxidoreductase [Nesterenkonia sp. E16_10]MBO0597443.1 SDR family NAD(P)-dependent oxidoreductase [Nesterenkonia sp. E16_7]
MARLISSSDSGFTATSTAEEVLEGVDLQGKTAVVTGASSGIGIETARALAGAGAHVVLAVRDVPAGRRAAEDVLRSHPAASLDVRGLDLADLDSVDRFTRAFSGPLHLLINNAGIMMTPELRTAQGWELQFATNHLGHFALALGLHPRLVEAGGARIVSVSSSGHDMSDIRYEDLFFDRGAYDPGHAYGQSKTANVLFAVEATRRWASEGIAVNAVMPGGIWTNLQRHWEPQALAETKAYVERAGIAMKSPAQGAATSVFAAASPLLEGIGGLYLEDCQEAEVVPEIINGTHGVRDYALDPENAARLWGVSAELLRQNS